MDTDSLTMKRVNGRQDTVYSLLVPIPIVCSAAALVTDRRSNTATEE